MEAEVRDLALRSLAAWLHRPPLGHVRLPSVCRTATRVSLSAQVDGRPRLVSARTPLRLAPVPATSRVTFDERSVLTARTGTREPASPGLSPSRINLVDSTAVHQGSIASSLLGITSRINLAPQYVSQAPSYGSTLSALGLHTQLPPPRRSVGSVGCQARFFKCEASREAKRESGAEPPQREREWSCLAAAGGRSLMGRFRHARRFPFTPS